MALYGLTITKNTNWHGLKEEFDNTYYFEGPAEPPDAAGLTALINEVANAEKPVHGINVNFIRGRVWSAGGNVVQNITLALIDLSGTGGALGGNMFPEAAIVVEWECDRPNIKGRKVYLRKFIRPCNSVGQMDAEASRGAQLMTAPMTTPFKTYADRVQTIVAPAGVNWQLKSRAGRLPKANNNGVVNLGVRSREFRRN